MKKSIFSTLILASITLFSFGQKKTITPAPVTTFTVDSTKSKVEWVGSKKSDFHTGYFPVKSGSIKVAAGKLVGGNFIVDVAGLKVTDGGGEKLKGHLFSADFLDALNFSEATFTITKVVYQKDDKATVTGTLNLHGVKAPISFTAYIRNTDEKGFFAEAFFPLNRSTFGINYNLGTNTDVQLAVHLYGNK
jgi:polyisoprenoid-binding protein YceI